MIYFGHKNDYWTNRQLQGGCLESNPEIVDLWKDNQPAFGLNGTKYEEYLFAEHVYDAINGFADTVDDEPFFMVYAPQFGVDVRVISITDLHFDVSQHRPLSIASSKGRAG